MAIRKSKVSLAGSCEEQNNIKHGFWYRLFHRKNKIVQQQECECGHDHSHIVVTENKTSQPIFRTEKEVQIKFAPAEEKNVESNIELKDNKVNNDVVVDNKPHEVVSLSDYENYNYEKRRKDWHEKAGRYEKQIACSFCKDKDNWETIKLENGKHICYFCWIKKPVNKKKKTTSKKTSKK